jgi:hypothetical protein
VGFEGGPASSDSGLAVKTIFRRELKYKQKKRAIFSYE